MRQTRKPNKSFLFLSVLSIVIAIAFGLYLYVGSILKPVNKNQAIPVKLTVEKGDSVARVGTRLVSVGLVRSQLAFRLAVYLEGVEENIQAGDYLLSPNMSVRNIAKTLTKGYEAGIVVTIPEGFRREQIGELLVDKLGISYQDFLTETKELEGYLFPDTYNFSKEASVNTILQVMQKNYEKKLGQNPPTYDDLILASIIERETLSKEEKGIVAGILRKRLNEGWALEVDASIQYIMGKKGEWWPTPLLGDRKIKSPYNSYINLGLPPGPICNPGLDAILAAQNPVSSPYYFYLHAKDGSIHYAQSNAEHEANIGKYIR